MKSKRRWLSLAATIIVITSVLSGCWGFSRPKKDLNTIVVWHWMIDRNQALEELAAQYQQKTGIKVKIDLYAPAEFYTQKIVDSAQTKVLPDIYGILDKKEVFASFIKSGFVADLTSAFQLNDQEWEKKFFKEALDVNRFVENNVYGVKEGIYGVPLDVTNIQMVYNVKLLKKAGIKTPPATFAEFLEAIQALKRIGVAGLVSGWGELWMLDCFASNYAFNIMGEEKIMATYRGEVPYTDSDWIKVLGIFKQLKDNGALIKGIETKPNKYAEQDFALERAAFAFNGSWGVNVYNGMNESLEYGVMLPPAINPALPMRIWGGAGSSLVVNNMSPRKEQAIAFLRWLSEKEQQAYLAKETKNLPANREALAEIPEVLSSFASAMDQTTHPTLWVLNEDPLVSEKFLKGIQSILMGEKTPEQIAQEVNEIKQQQILKKQN